MALKAAIVTRALHSRGVAAAAVVWSLVVFALCFFGDDFTPVEGNKGFALLSANLWFAGGVADFAAAMGAYALQIALMVAICKIFNVLRSMTWLHVTLFAFMLTATPDLAAQFYTGTLLLPVVEVCVMLLLAVYRDVAAPRHVFLIFALLSLGIATQYCYVAYILVFAMGMLQMRIFSGRTAVAALLGIVTPWWIMFGFGIITPADIRLADLDSIFSAIDFGDALLLVITVGLSFILIILSLVLNVFRTIAYNARARAVNGLFTVLALVTMVACCADFRNIIAYIPLLNFCAALLTAHYFATHRAERSWIAITLIIAAYTALYICQRMI